MFANMLTHHTHTHTSTVQRVIDKNSFANTLARTHHTHTHEYSAKEIHRVIDKNSFANMLTHTYTPHTPQVDPDTGLWCSSSAHCPSYRASALGTASLRALPEHHCALCRTKWQTKLTVYVLTYIHTHIHTYACIGYLCKQYWSCTLHIHTYVHTT